MLKKLLHDVSRIGTLPLVLAVIVVPAKIKRADRQTDWSVDRPNK
jgi:hypothetical protein